MDLSIIILNYHSSGLCKTCVRGILKAPMNISYEIIVVDNGSSDGISAMMRQHYPALRFIQAGRNLGHCAGNNLGVQAASGQNILILNPDIAILDNALEKMVQYLNQNSKVVAVGCQLKNPDGSTQYSCRHFYHLLTPLCSRTILGRTSWGQRHMRNFLMTEFNHNQNGPVDWIQGSCLMLKRAIVEKIGLMDERFFLYFGDVDWCRRVWQADYEVHHLGVASVIHYFHRESAGGISALLKPIGRIHFKDWIQYLGKYHVNKIPMAKS